MTSRQLTTMRTFNCFKHLIIHIFKKMEFNTTEEIIEDIAAGKMVILLDDEDRENEGDLVCAAELVDDKKINFMISKAKGLVCLPLSPQKCDQLNLPMMTNNNRAKHGTGFTVSIEAAQGISTGISAEDRARTIIAASKKMLKQKT
jgi:3,4-dihydroxy 2-butanone 4-phosphate synthase/GTP cyclohydrolase II